MSSWIRWLSLATLVCCSLVLCSRARAEAPPPSIVRPVTDLAGVLRPSSVEVIEQGLAQHQKVTGVQIAVLIVNTTAGGRIEDFSHRTAKAWGGGQKGQDNGVLFVLALADRRSRIEVGTGLEGRLPDAAAREILDEARGELRAGDHDGAVARVASRIIERTGGPAHSIVAPEGGARKTAGNTPPAKASAAPSTPVILAGFFGAAVVFFGIALLVNWRWGNHGESSSSSSSSDGSSSSSSSGPPSSRRFSSSSSSSSSDSSSSSSDSSGSGGGGSFGGGGASSDW